MQQELWAECARPTVAALSTVFAADLVRVSDLTLSRGRFNERLRQPRPPLDVAEDDVERLLLAFEELTSNGLRHGGAPVRVTVTASVQGWLIDVADAAVEQPPRPAIDRDPARGGLGLYLVARLSQQHGWSVEGTFKHVWACLRPAQLA